MVPGTYQKPGKPLLGDDMGAQAHQGPVKGLVGVADASSEAGDRKL